MLCGSRALNTLRVGSSRPLSFDYELLPCHLLQWISQASLK
jgi:hypothetical protein